MKLFDRLFKKPGTDSPKAEPGATCDVPRDLPGYLVYPEDPIAQKMYGSQMQEVCDRRCGYQFMLYTGIADVTPEVREQTPRFELNETHIYWKPDSPSCCSVSTMKSPSVKTSDLQKWVTSGDQIGMMLGAMFPFLNLPSQWDAGEYRRVRMYDLGESAGYNRLHGFDQSRVYCHVFYLGDRLYKKFILCAKRGTSSWKVECTFPSEHAELLLPDMVPPGQVFGSFKPVEHSGRA